MIELFYSSSYRSWTKNKWTRLISSTINMVRISGRTVKRTLTLISNYTVLKDLVKERFMNTFEKFMMVTNTIIASRVWVTLAWIIQQ